MAMFKREEPTGLRDVPLIFKNFGGEARKFNAEGIRNFSVMLNEQDALELESKGWNVKALKRREEDDEQLYHLKVAVNFNNKPPRIWLITARGTKRTLLPEDTIMMLDFLEASKVDLEITPYDWKLDSGQTGRKAYLHRLYFHLYESPLELEYSELEEVPMQVGQAAIEDSDGPLQLEPAGRLPYDYEGEVED